MPSSSVTSHKWFTPSFIATLVGWLLTLVVFVWNFSATNAQFEYRLEALKQNQDRLEERMDDADALRTTIQTQLAEIKTDLLWIRNELSSERNN